MIAESNARERDDWVDQQWEKVRNMTCPHGRSPVVVERVDVASTTEGDVGPVWIPGIVGCPDVCDSDRP